jgi:hypothetical protein
MKLVTDDDIFKQPTSSTRTKVTPISRVTAVGIKVSDWVVGECRGRVRGSRRRGG